MRAACAQFCATSNIDRNLKYADSWYAMRLREVQRVYLCQRRVIYCFHAADSTRLTHENERDMFVKGLLQQAQESAIFISVATMSFVLRRLVFTCQLWINGD